MFGGWRDTGERKAWNENSTRPPFHTFALSMQHKFSFSLDALQSAVNVMTSLIRPAFSIITGMANQLPPPPIKVRLWRVKFHSQWPLDHKPSNPKSSTPSVIWIFDVWRVLSEKYGTFPFAFGIIPLCSYVCLLCLLLRIFAVTACALTYYYFFFGLVRSK